MTGVLRDAAPRSLSFAGPRLAQFEGMGYALRRIRREPGFAVFAVAMMDRAVSPRRFIRVILGAFAGTVQLLAALGIHAVLSYSVSQRIREIGIRMALGELSASVRRRVVARTLMLAGLGVVLGAAVSLGAYW